jgi:hypothetical protein
MPALGSGAWPRAHSCANPVTGQPLASPPGERQSDGDRPVHEPAQHTSRRGGDHRATSPAPIAPEPQSQRFRAGCDLPRAHHRALSETVPNEPAPPASSGRARNATARAVHRAHRSNRRWSLRPKFDVDIEIRDPLIAPLPFVDRCRSTTGTTIGVGSRHPFVVVGTAPMHRLHAAWLQTSAEREQNSRDGHWPGVAPFPIRLRERDRASGHQLAWATTAACRCDISSDHRRPPPRTR